MAIELDHLHVPSRDRFAGAKLLAELLDVLRRIRAAGIAYRATPHGPADMRVGTYGGRNVYWNEPDGHVWELLTASCARQPRA